ncbi:sugar ABC transporter substrate-binding protein [Nonomuraea sp. NPDC050310]|uniref:ABC transporter substrate-binding protein n=1 Tax=unclassified Nonomuraea TaxID=2593643 RepID=UPI0034058560
MKSPRIRLTLAALLALPLAACGSGGGSSESAGPVTLTYRLWDEQQKVGYDKVMAAFEKANPNIKVKIEVMPYDDYWTKLTADAVAGSAPDVFWMQVSYFPAFVTKGVLADLSPLKLDPAKYHPNVVASNTYEGKLYGVPKDWGMPGLLYNKDLFEKAGVEMPDKLTWAPDGSGTLVELAKKLTVDEAGKHPGEAGFNPDKIKTYGFASTNHSQTQWMNWIESNGGKLVDKPFGKYVFNDAASAEAVQFGVDLITKHHVSPPATQTNPPTGKAADMFKGGQVAMYPANNALLPYVAPEINFGIGVAMMPEGPKGRAVNINGLGESVYAKSKHPEEAMKLAKYLAGEEAQKSMADQGYIFPALVGDSLAQGYIDFWKNNAKPVDVTPFLEQSKGTTFNMPIVTGWTGFEQKLTGIFNEVYLGKITAQQGVEQAVTEGNATIK